MERLKPLADVRESFRARRREAWFENTDYWLSANLRHVEDLGEWIADYLVCELKPGESLIDMGSGSGWLGHRLKGRIADLNYLGVDIHEPFVEVCRREFDRTKGFDFIVLDVEQPNHGQLPPEATFVVNAFNLFELTDLRAAYSNASSWLRPGGRFLAITIDKTYLMMAAANSWEEYRDLLIDYSAKGGPKCFFQAIDLGDGPSPRLVYPSVLYSTEDYLAATAETGLEFRRYREFPFTQRPLPKIYQVFEFQKRTT